MSITPEEKTLLWEIQSALVKIQMRHVGGEHVFTVLDEACRDWLNYRELRSESDASIDDLELSVLVDNMFLEHGIKTIAQVRGLTDAHYKEMGLRKVNMKATRKALAEWDEAHSSKSVGGGVRLG